MVNYSMVANGPKDHIILYYLSLFITSFVWNVQHTNHLLHTRHRIQIDSFKYKLKIFHHLLYVWCCRVLMLVSHRIKTSAKNETFRSVPFMARQHHLQTYVFLFFKRFFLHLMATNQFHNQYVNVFLFERQAQNDLVRDYAAIFAPFHCYLAVNYFVCEFATGFYYSCCVWYRKPIKTCKWKEKLRWNYKALQFTKKRQIVDFLVFLNG